MDAAAAHISLYATGEEKQMICNACSGTSFKEFAVRQDGMQLMQCVRCGLGVIARLPTGTAQYYDDNYYLDGGSRGYEDYTFMAEHGLSWAAAVIQLLAKQGKILDIGCANGYLLNKLASQFEKYGIEVNAKAAKQAELEGIKLLGNDLLDPRLAADHRGAFDVVTAIAVFEHLLDFRGGFEAAISLLKEDGLLLFEVPVMSATGSNAAWMQGSFEHIYYPTEGSIRHIVEVELDCQLAGAEVSIKDFASTYIGIVTKERNRAVQVKALLERLMISEFQNAPLDEVRAATHLHLIHAGQATDETVRSLVQLETRDFTSPLIARIAQLWTFDLRRLHAAAQQLAASQTAIAHLERLRTDMESVQADTRLSAARATTLEGVVTSLRRQLEIEDEKLRRELALADEKHRRQLEIAEERTRESESRAYEAARKLQEIEQSTAWRATGPIRRWGIRNAKLARRVRQLAKLISWTGRGTVLTQMRAFMQRRALAASAVLSAKEAQAADEAASKVRLLPTTCFSDEIVEQPSGAVWPADRPLVSVVIPCFNYGHLVSDAIRSVEAQTFSDIEIIVVEGGSTSAESRQRLMEATAHASSRLRVLVQDSPHRAGANRNLGVSHARGKYICCLDADDRLAPTYLEKAVFMLQHSGYDVISPGLQFFGDKSEVWIPHERPTLDMLLEGNNALTCAVYSREWWRKAGGYRDSDRATGHIHEDWLFWVRLAALGARFLCIKEPLFLYRSHAGTLSNSSDVLEHEVQKRLVARLNGDVLTDEALQAGRAKSLPPLRPPQFFMARQGFHAAASNTGPTLLIAVPFLVLGGAERLLSAVVAELARHGWRIVIVTTVPVGPEHGDTTSWFETATCEIFHLPRFLDPPYWCDFLNHLCQSRDIQLLWVIGSAFVYENLPALKLKYPRLGVADLLFNTVGHTANNRRYADCIDLTFVENSEVKQWLMTAGELPTRISLVESGVDLDQNRPTAHRNLPFGMEAIPDGAVVVGFFGRWSEEKDPLGFIRIARLLASNPHIIFLMTGAGPLDAVLGKEIAAASFKPGQFLLKGAVPDIKPYLQLCDILCLPSRLDGRPNIVMEALACGTAVIASRVGALPEMIEDGEQGYLCTPGVYEEFVLRIKELATDQAKLQLFKVKARKFAERRFDIVKMLRAYEAKLYSLIRS